MLTCTFRAIFVYLFVILDLITNRRRKQCAGGHLACKHSHYDELPMVNSDLIDMIVTEKKANKSIKSKWSQSVVFDASRRQTTTCKKQSVLFMFSVREIRLRNRKKKILRLRCGGDFKTIMLSVRILNSLRFVFYLPLYFFNIRK